MRVTRIARLMLCATVVWIATQWPMNVAGSDAAILSARQARVFALTCAHCHVRPGIGVPVVGDKSAWRERKAKGFDALLANTVTGFGNMPPLGTCSFCSEDDLRHLVAFIAGVPLPEGTAP